MEIKEGVIVFSHKDVTEMLEVKQDEFCSLRKVLLEADKPMPFYMEIPNIEAWYGVINKNVEAD